MSLPAGWASAQIGEVAELVRGVTYDKIFAQSVPELGFTPIARATNIQRGLLDQHDLVHVPDRFVDQRQMLRSGDVLVATSSGSRTVVGKAARVDDSHDGIAFGAFCGVVRPHVPDVAAWLARVFETAEYRCFVERVAIGTNINNLRTRDLEAYHILLPPAAEQRRIVEKLDALTARLARARAELDRVQVLADRLREVALTSAFDGKLVDEGREPQADWMIVPFEEAGEITGKLVPPATISDLPHIAPNHIQSGRPVLLPYKTIGQDEVISGKYRFYPGQLIYSKIRPYLRKVVLVDFEGGCSADMYPINPRCNARYLMYWMLSPQFTWLATQQEGRTVLPKINQNALNAIPTPLAPEPIQERLATVLDAIFARADRLEAEAARARALIDRLESAILAKAFRGELVPQDPNDEPASVLLERIRAQRAAAPSSKRGRRAAAADA